jgi:hypothetical protein
MRVVGRASPETSGWVCPACGRLFGRTRQAHDCEPGLTLEEYFASGPAHERPVYDAVMAHVTTLGPVHADIVSVGIFLKNPRTFAQLRPMRRWVAVWFPLLRVARHRTITRAVQRQGDVCWHVANAATAGDVDDGLCDLLSEAYRTV